MNIGRHLIIAAIAVLFVWNCSNGSKTTIHSEIPKWLRDSWYRVENESDYPDTGLKSIQFSGYDFEQIYFEDGKEFTYKHKIDKVKITAPEDMRYGEVDIHYAIKRGDKPDAPRVLNISFSDKKETLTISLVSPSGMNDGAGPLPEEDWYVIGEFSPQLLSD